MNEQEIAERMVADLLSGKTSELVVPQQMTGANQPPAQAVQTRNGPGTLEEQMAFVEAYSRGELEDGAYGIKGPPVPFKETFEERNTTPGIPLDTETGLGMGIRARLSMLGGWESQLKYLSDRFGPENVRISSERTPIVRIPKAGGGVKDVVVDERYLSPKDLADLANVIPEVVGAVVGVARGRGIGALKNLTGLRGAARDVGAGALGGQLAGGAADIMAQGLAGQVPDVGEIARRRASNAGVEMATGGLLSAGTAASRAVVQKLMGPFAGQATDVQRAALAGVEAIKSRTGIDLPLTPAERTGNEILSMAEGFLGNVPGSKNRMARALNEREEAIRRFQGHVMGTGSMPGSQDVGKRTVDLFSQVADQKLKATTLAQQKAVQELDETILAEIDRLSVADRQLLAPDVGRNIRAAIVAKRDAFKEQAKQLYELVAADPNGKKAIVPTVRLRSAIRDIERELVKDAGRVVPVISPILGPTGKPVVVGNQLKREVIPSLNTGSTLSKLAGLKQLPENMTLEEARNVRRAISDLIESGQSMPDVPTRHLVKLSEALTESMSDAVRKLPSGDLKDKLARANKYYKDHHWKYREKGVADLFRPSDAPGYVGDSEVVRRIVANGGNVDALKQAKNILGEKSPEYLQLKRMALEAVYDTTLLDLDGKLASASAVVDRISRLDKAVRDELFDKPAIFSMSAVQRLSKQLGSGEIDLGVFKTALAGKKNLYGALEQARRAFTEQQRYFNNKVMKPFLKGEGDVTAIAPEDFVHKWLGLASIDQTVEAMNLIAREDPALMSGIRRKTIQNIFQAAARKPRGTDVLRNLEGDPTAMVSASTLYKSVFQDEKARAKYMAVLGKPVMENLEDYMKFEMAREAKDAVSKNAGGLVKGSIVNHLLSLDVGAVARIGKFRLASILMTSGLPLKWIGSNIDLPDITKVTAAIAVSDPVLRGIAEEFGDESPGAIKVLNSIAKGLTGQTQTDHQTGYYNPSTP